MFAPRVGLTYQLNDKTVIRTGYGRSFDIGVFGSVFGHVVTQNLPVLANQSINNKTTTSPGVYAGHRTGGSDADRGTVERTVPEPRGPGQLPCPSQPHEVPRDRRLEPGIPARNDAFADVNDGVCRQQGNLHAG